jgi:hypothetical protein
VMRRPRCCVPSAVISRSHPPASPTPSPQARWLTRAEFPLAPPGGRGTVVGDVHHRRTVTRGGDKCWRRRRHCGHRSRGCCRFFLLRARGHSRAARRLTCPRPDHRVVVTGSPDLSALAGARAGTIGVTLRTKIHKDEHQPLEIKGVRGKCYLPQAGEDPLPLPRGFRGAAVAPASAAMALAGASAVLAGSSIDNPVAGASAPATGTNSIASVARGDGGGGFHLSGGTHPHRSPPPPPPLPTMTPMASPDGRVLAARVADTPHCTAPGAPAA